MLDLGCVFCFQKQSPLPPKKKHGEDKSSVPAPHKISIYLFVGKSYTFIVYSVCFLAKGHHGWLAKNHAPQTFGFKLCCLFLHPFAGSHGISLPTVAGQRRTIAAVLASMNPKLNDQWLVHGLLHPRYCHLYLVHMFVLIIAPKLQG